MSDRLSPPIRFRAPVISGAGRGKQMGVPTLNVALPDVPAELQQGIFACWVFVEGKKHPGALHYGPRPVFDNSIACEVHLLDTMVTHAPVSIELEIVAFLRDIRNFSSPEMLKMQIDDDIRETKNVLGLS